MKHNTITKTCAGCGRTMWSTESGVFNYGSVCSPSCEDLLKKEEESDTEYQLELEQELGIENQEDKDDTTA